MQTAAEIAEARFHRAQKAHIKKSLGFEGNGIIEKLTEIYDARNAVAHEHRPIRRFGIGAALSKRLFPP